jgi:hypothetical protein
MRITERCAAIYVRRLSPAIPGSGRSLESSLEQCRRYCATRGYQLEEQHIYQGDEEPIWSNAPLLVDLRMAAFQRQFNVLVIPSPEDLSIYSPQPWRSLSATRVIRQFYEHQVCVESVVERYGFHDLDKQMLKAALNFAALYTQAESAQWRMPWP